jgi:hypothetical protein
MKKMSCLVLLLWSASTLKAQPRIGFEMGVSLSNPSFYRPAGQALGNGTIATTGSEGFTTGIFLLLPLAKQIYMRPALQIAFRGERTQQTFNGVVYRNQQSATYVDLPLPVIYAFSSRQSTVFAGAGPALSFFLGSSRSYKTGIGINGLIGYQIPIGVSLKASYLFGLTNLAYDPSLFSYRNRFLDFAVGYVF